MILGRFTLSISSRNSSIDSQRLILECIESALASRLRLDHRLDRLRGAQAVLWDPLIGFRLVAFY
jgi:hypothetical protein